jgi:signal transduction histidine kinase
MSGEAQRMAQPAAAEALESRPRLPIILALYLFYLATAGRTVASLAAEPKPLARAAWLLGLQLLFILLWTLAVWRPPMPRPWLYAYLVFQSGLIVTQQALAPGMDYLISFFVLLDYQVATLPGGWTRWAWIAGFGLLSAGTLSWFLGPLQGLALSLIASTGQFAMTAVIVISRELEAAQARSQVTLLDLQDTRKKLEEYASQVEELAAIEEHNRLARDLHDSVSQAIFSIRLDARSAQLLLDQDPAQTRAMLVRLQGQVQSALAALRGVISQLRYKNN